MVSDRDINYTCMLQLPTIYLLYFFFIYTTQNNANLSSNLIMSSIINNPIINCRTKNNKKNSQALKCEDIPNVLHYLMHLLPMIF